MTKIIAKKSWNRLDKTVHYKSLDGDSPKIDASFKQNKKGVFVLHNLKVMSNGYYPKDLQNKLKQIQDGINRDYNSKVRLQ